MPPECRIAFSIQSEATIAKRRSTARQFEDPFLRHSGSGGAYGNALASNPDINGSGRDAHAAFPVGRKEMTSPARGNLAFVDSMRTANWGHPCPPFLGEVAPTLRLIWKGPDVPDAVLATRYRPRNPLQEK